MGKKKREIDRHMTQRNERDVLVMWSLLSRCACCVRRVAGSLAVRNEGSRKVVLH